MIRILLDGIKYIQMQIEDFLGRIVEVILDLREDLRPYLEFFGRPPGFYRRVKKGELSLIRSSSAFRRMHSAHNPGNAQWTAKQAFMDVSKENLIYA